jgi:Mlc titration factor MtfA (ptsG expression regulator)
VSEFAVVLGALALFAAAYVAVSVVVRRLPAAPRVLPRQPIPAAWYAVLEQRVPLARALAAEERERLLRLVQVFLAEKRVEGCQGLVVTEEMKVTIAAAACLLLLHVPGTCYPTVRTVLVYPSSFVPKYTRPPERDHIVQPPVPLVGQSWRGGVVVLSWDDVLSSARDPADGHNVVLHEFAHQLDREDGDAEGTPLLPGGALRAWARVLAAEYERLRRDAAAGRPSVLDAYGATDPAEFFAVATETFFEKPAELEREHPALYTQLKQFYGQDPAHAMRSAPRGAA